MSGFDSVVQNCRNERKFPAAEIAEKLAELPEAAKLFGEQFLQTVLKCRTRTAAKQAFCDRWEKMRDDKASLVLVVVAARRLGNKWLEDFLRGKIEQAFEASRAERHEIDHLFEKHKSDLEEAAESSLSDERVRPVKLRTFGIPFSPSKYHSRSKCEDSIFDGIKAACISPEKGMFVVSGGKGIGKSTMVAHLLSNEKRQNELVKDAGVEILFWVDCSHWRSPDQWNESELTDRIFQIKKSAIEQDWPTFTGLASVIDYFKINKKRILFVLDRVENVALLDHVRSQDVSSAAFCILTREVAPLKKKSSKQLPLIEHKIPALEGAELVELLGSTLGLSAIFNGEQLGKLAGMCKGLPYYATLVAKQFYENPVPAKWMNTFKVMTADPKFLERLNTKPSSNSTSTNPN